MGACLKNFYTAFAALFIVLISLGTRSAFAQEQTPVVPKPLAQFKIYPDRTDLEFEDGRIARLMVSVRAFKLQLKTQLQVIENACAPEVIGEGCEWVVDYYDARLAFVWVLHPDSSQLNKVLNIKNYFKTSADAEPVLSSETALEGAITSPIQSVLFPQVGPPELHCKDDRWIKQMYQNSTQKIIIPSWNTEFMQNNEITGKNENLSLFQLNNSELIPFSEGRYKLNITDPAATMFSKITPFQETQTMYFLQNQKQCSILLKNSVDEVRKVVPPDDPNQFVSEYPAVMPEKVPTGLVLENAFKIRDLLITEPNRMIIVESL